MVVGGVPASKHKVLHIHVRLRKLTPGHGVKVAHAPVANREAPQVLPLRRLGRHLACAHQYCDAASIQEGAAVGVLRERRYATVLDSEAHLSALSKGLEGRG